MNRVSRDEDRLALCDGKESLTRELALQITKRNGPSKSRDKRRTAYKCPVCRQWHIGQPPMYGKGRK